MIINRANGQEINPATEDKQDLLVGAYGKHIIVGNVARTAPVGFYYWSFKPRTEGVIFSALKKDAALTPIAAGTTEEVFKTVPLVLNNGDWETFDNKITSIKLTGANDSITAYLKPLDK